MIRDLRLCAWRTKGQKIGRNVGQMRSRDANRNRRLQIDRLTVQRSTRVHAGKRGRARGSRYAIEMPSTTESGERKVAGRVLDRVDLCVACFSCLGRTVSEFLSEKLLFLSVPFSSFQPPSLASRFPRPEYPRKTVLPVPNPVLPSSTRSSRFDGPAAPVH